MAKRPRLKKRVYRKAAKISRRDFQRAIATADRIIKSFIRAKRDD